MGIAIDNLDRSGVIALLWLNNWSVEIKSYSYLYIDVYVELDHSMVWRFTGIYGCPHHFQRHHTWELLRWLNTHLNIPWLIRGDFNEILEWNEKVGGRYRSWTEIQKFCDTLEECGPEDLGFRDP
ncbi:Endonuclease/exonuclease/phosphatase [Trema orientale]|uniref:Endonuclease/exonuclease/phosphatase n=1 Tax=Trema orientale TaxID=63057 RepID=A0A2P5DQ82_TREOI|nr:Endonuclease/exonuclease/phosphatase [Trema orientale]